MEIIIGGNLHRLLHAVRVIQNTVDLQFLGLDVNQDVTGLANQITCLAVPYIPLDGINDAGVACGIYMTYQQ